MGAGTSSAVASPARRFAVGLAVHALGHPLAAPLMAGLAVAALVVLPGDTALSGALLLGAGGVGFVVRAPRPRADDVPGETVGPGDEPALADLVRTAAGTAGLQRAVEVRVAPGTEVRAFPVPRVRGGAVLLEVGVLAVRALPAGVLSALAVRAFVEVVDPVPGLDRWLATGRRELAGAVVFGAFALPGRPARRALAAATPHVARRTLDADARAAALVGPAVLAGALEAVELLRCAETDLVDEWQVALAATGRFPVDVDAALAEALADPLVAARLGEDVPADDEQFLLPEPPDLAVRRAALLGCAAPSGAGAVFARPAGRPVTVRSGGVVAAWWETNQEPYVFLDVDPYGDPDDAVGARLLALPADDLLPPDRGAVTAALIEATAAPNVDAAVRAAVEQIGAGRTTDLADRVLSAEALADDPPFLVDADDLVVAVVSLALAERLRAAGLRRASRWLHDVLVLPDGEVVDVAALVRRAVDDGGTETLDRLVALLDRISSA